jgi:predicted dithiol-disulfide oxidoreductase (DUF899 family)
MSFRSSGCRKSDDRKRADEMTEHTKGTRVQWLAARIALLAEEKELSRRGEELARKRQALPWVAVEKEYRFETDEGTKTLAELFDGRFAVFTEEGRKSGTGFNLGTPKHAAEIDLRRDELHGLSAFALEDGVAYHTYSCYDRGTDVLSATWQLLDPTPPGRGDGPEGWPRRHDEYEGARGAP